MKPVPPHRKQLRRIEAPGQARFLTFSCYHRLPLLDNEKIKSLFAHALAALREEGRFDLYGWVVMPEHVHLLVFPHLPAHPISSTLRQLKRSIAQAVLNRWSQLDAPILSRITDAHQTRRFWQTGGGYDRNIISQEELLEKLNYIHENPVKRGLAASAADYLWSSARWYAGDRTGPIPIDPIEW
jgi:putative transposase